MQDHYKIEEVQNTAYDRQSCVPLEVLFLFLDESKKLLLHIVPASSVYLIKTDISAWLKSVEV